nr:unnamed protein product [Callosobruchus chinensis]
MFMLAYWRLNKAPADIQTLEIVFPIVGQSFLPTGTVFGLTERKIKKQNVIIKISNERSMNKCLVITLQSSASVSNGTSRIGKLRQMRY